MNHTNYAQNETPDHPHAAVIAAQLELVRPLLDTWRWTVYEGGDLVLTMRRRGDGTSLRVWVSQLGVNLDVNVCTVPFDTHMLTWILMENFGQEYKARASDPKDDRVVIFVTADYPLESLPELAQLIWAGYDAALGWRGRIWQVEIPQQGRPGA